MSATSSLETAANLLTAWGFPVAKRTGWASKKARTDIAFSPSGVIFHHTAAWTTTDALLFDTGNGKIKAPLCHWSIDRDGRITLGAGGYANHAGINSKAAVAKILAGADAEVKPGPDDDGYSANRYTVGIEVKCPGAYNEAQRKAAVALGAALVIAFGWDKARVPAGAHKEITRRKPGDPGDDMGAFRAEVRALIKTKTAPPPKPAPKSAQVTVLVANCQSYDGDCSEAAWRARAQLMAKSSPDVILVQETTDPGRKAMCDELGKGWSYHSNGKSVAILIGPRVKKAGLKRTVSFGTAFGHGAVKLPLKVDGVGFDAISQHTRPASILPDKIEIQLKNGDVAKGATLAGTWPAIFGGDFSLNDPRIAGWIRATPKFDSVDRPGPQSPDAIFTKGSKVKLESAKLIDPGNLSDHKWVVATFTVSA
ncbi:N-acetylmuramoyl-L-alanine amidase [Propionicimonas paludicola]|uniref:N-acetylmuramoyl-L-alanine amidase n=1 Tax=Propionicimonas paludicola TaxID=185243 RepID=A0A2A9CU84_9ACTN|nr:N-acetylmuramoyl-L-alanine amidase [Propionicimonas paludicola]PFG17180.1 N-acetylmuramoyl-L-alanine amidase [Propionicimonas paludicola]